MKDIKLLTYGRLAKEFEQYVINSYPQITVVRPTNLKQVKEKVRQVNALAGFYFLNQLDLSNIQWIHSFGAGVDLFLSKTNNWNHDITITRTIGKLGDKIGEYCLAYVLGQYKHVIKTYKQQNESVWIQHTGENLYDKNVLILGTGTIGSGVAKAFNQKVKRIVGVNKSGKQNSSFDAVISWQDFKNINFDVIINALPNTPNTEGILNREFFEQFNNAIFVNVGRGDAVVETGLLYALDNNHLRSAILDVFSEEPLPTSSKLWKHNKLIITPHQSGLTTITDIKHDFEQAYLGVTTNKKNTLFVNKKRGY